MEFLFNLPWGNGGELHLINKLPSEVNPFVWLTSLLSKADHASDLEVLSDIPSVFDGTPADDILNVLVNKDILSKAGKKGRKEPIRTEIQPPDIGEGLGRNQVKRDINSLAQFVKSKARWLVNQNTLYVYNDLCWEKLEQDNAIRHIRDICSEYQEFVEVLTNSEYKKIYSDLLYAPELNIDEELVSPPGVVNFNDGEIDFFANPLKVLKHNPEHHFTSFINVSAQEVLNPSMAGTTFERFVNHISGGNVAVRTQLLELLAVVLTGAQLKHFFVLLGPSNSGKTQWGRFVEELLGRTQVETVRGIHDFGDRWTIGSLAGKKLATCLDLPNKALPSAAVGIIKQFCGDDPVKGEVKYANSFTYYQKPLLLFAGNHPIRLSNAHREEAFWNRMIVIPSSNPVQEEDMELNLYQKFLDEAPHIIREAIVVYQKLAMRNFVLTRSEVPQEYQQTGFYGCDSVRDFVQDRLTERDGDGISTKELYEAFNARCSQDMTLTTFSRALAAVVQELFPLAMQVKRANKAGERGYKNLGFISDN